MLVRVLRLELGKESVVCALLRLAGEGQRNGRRHAPLHIGGHVAESEGARTVGNGRLTAEETVTEEGEEGNLRINGRVCVSVTKPPAFFV